MASHSPRNTRIPMPRREGTSSAPPVVKSGTSVKSGGVKKEPLSTFTGITSSTSNIPSSKLSGARKTPSFIVVTSCASTNSVEISKCNDAHSTTENNMENTSMTNGSPEISPQAQTKVKIYTDWANHYLEKARHKRFISDLQQDVTDGVLLADVIEAVTNEKIKDIKNKPKNSAQMVENINTCLTFLATLGVNVEGLSAKDIKEGNLKSILGLFFSLSRFKQQQKSLHQQNKEHSQSKVQQGEVTLDNQHSGIGRNTPQLNGGEMLSRLPSPFKSGSKCPTITNPSSKDGQAHTSTSINNSRNSKSQNHSNDKVTRSQLNQQNNNISSSSSSSGSTYLNTKNNNPASSRATSPGTGAGGSGIPTPGGRSLVSPRGSDKQPRAVSSGSTTSTSSTASNKSTSHKATAAAANKNSMLDKFKFFNSKDKSKSKGGVPKSTSKSSTTSTSSCSDRSDVRSTTSSARSSSSTDPGASSSTPSNDSEPQSPKLPPKTGKSLVKGFGGRRELGGVGTDEVGAKLSNQGPSIPTVPPTHSSQSHSPGKKVSGKSDRRETRSAQASPTQGKKGATKIGSLIPKSSSGKSSSSKSSPSNGPNSSQIPTPGSSIPKPSSSLGKSSKSTKEEKSRLQSKSQHSSPTSSSSLPQKSHHVSSPKSMQYQPQAPQPSNSITQSKGSTHTPEGSSDQSNVSSQDPVSDDKMQHRTRYTEIEYSDGRIERVGEGHFAKPNNLLVSPKVGGGHYQDRSHEVAGQPNMVPSSQTVNVVKPTCSVATTSTTVMTKSDGNTQTSLSVLNRATPPPLPKTEPPQKSHAKDKEYKMSGSQSGSGHSTPVSGTDSTPSSQSGSNTTGSSSESVICNKSLNVDDFSGSDKSSTSATSSPRLGMKVIHSQLQRPANNVAIVQPRHGEKIETTFDTEIRTETVNKDSDTSKNNLRETTFSEKSEKDPTFVDDSGEAMDIKPMQPIMRAMPYGSSGYLRGYGSPGSPASGKIFHNPGYATPTTAYYARTSSLGINRPMIGDPNKYYPGSIKRTQSTGQNSSIDTDYSSDYDTYDYVSGYMSDGDILKGNKMGDDMSSGYLSEGGASLYARRLQQRFREGMQAVKECMQKSTGLLDDDSFDDSSSISSGDISDTINEISTDEGNLTGGSSRDSERNPYSSLKRNPKELGRNLNNGNFQGQFPTQKRAPNLGTSAFLGSDYSSDAPPVSGWRKYSLPQTNRLLSSDPADYAHLYNGYDHSQWRPNQANVGQLRKLSNSSQPEIHHYRAHSADSADTQSDKGGYSSAGFLTKRDSETNTDQSHLLDSSMRRMQTQRAHSAGGQVTYGYRRPLSNTSNSSVGSNKSTGSNTGKTSAVGSRLAKHGMLVEQGQPNGKSMDVNGGSSIPRPGSATGMRATTPGGGNPRTDMGPEAYSSATLERKKKGLNGSPKSTSAAQTDPGELYKSNTLGRTKKVFGSRNSLSKTQAQGENGSLCSSTIISNPHATYSKGGPQSPQNGSHNGTYVAMEYGSPRNSGAGQGVWLKTPNGTMAMGMSETESMESISSHASSIQAQIQQARALSGASARILAHRDGQGTPNGLSRSNSLKSSQSDSMYAQHSQMSEDITRTNSFSQLPSPPAPSSPTPSNSSHSSSRFTYPMTAAYGSGSAYPANSAMVRSNTQSSLPYGSLALSKINKEEDSSRLTKSSTLDYSYFSGDFDYASVHGSNLSLVSSSSSIYSSNEEKHNHEIRKLRRELESAQEKVVTLSTQLSTNAHVVAAFEQSLSNMTNRLQHLTCTAEQKDSELNELRVTIEALKRQSGLNIPDPVISPNAGRRHTSPGMVANCSPQQHPSPHHTPGRAFHTLPMPLEGRMTRQMSTDSVSSINSMSSACSMTSQQSAATDGDIGKKKKKKGWLRSSFSKAFSRKKNRNGSMSDCELDSTSFRSNMSAPNSPLLQVHMPNGSGLIKGSHSSSALYEAEDMGSVLELRKQLRDKDMKLTDIRLEALSSAHQLEQLRETMTKMKSEMGALKADNDRLQRMMSARNLNTSQNSLAHTRTGSNSDTLERSLSMQEQPSLEMLLAETPDREGKRVTIMVYLGSNPDPMRIGVEKPAEVLIGSLSVSGKTKWDILDNIVRKILKEYVLRVDPVTNLGLSAESVCMYHIGEIIRTKNADLPELLPVGYLVGDTMQIGICLKGTKQNSVDSLAFETLIPKSIVQRYVSLLLEHRRIILCGPSGTGKTYLAQKLAEHLVLRSGKELTAGSVATFNVDHKSAKELRQYLSNIADQCENSSVGELPSVIILDNLHHVGSLGEVFNGFLSVKYQKCPYIIGTMNQATCSTTNLQLHHNFRWVLCANHMEPVKGFLGRYLRRKLVEAEVRTSIRNNDLNKIIDWIPKVWLHLNKFLETHSSSDVTIGPRLFLSCPMEIPGSKIWFTDLWNYSIIPYMLEAVREGLQVYGRRAPWEDPTDWVLETYPWATAKDEDPALLRIRPEDVGYDTQGVISAGNSPQPQKAKTLEMKQSGNGDPLVPPQQLNQDGDA
ncbi:neuron navigator 3-like isoform X3 [Argopecten irradians]|uniref:neuron navigator 3-like isoform X3 n=1 Tax=Argopecten irradians TaxID=31199 RepID=UPI00371F57A6